MNKEQVNKYKKEIIAFCEGKTIEWRYKIPSVYGEKTRWSSWSINDNPDFILTENYQYRIKPEPKELWCVYNSAEMLLYVRKTKEAAEDSLTIYNKDSGDYIVHLIEDTAV